MRAYDEVYLRDAMACLASMVDYLVNACGIDGQRAFEMFETCRLAQQFERGNPSLVSGRSGIELAWDMLEASYTGAELGFPKPVRRMEKSPEYWAGTVLARVQWESGCSFKRILKTVPFSEIVRMYPLSHEADITLVTEEIARCMASVQGSRLKTQRERAGLTQEELSRVSGVGLRSIQMYEQRVNDIDKAQARSVVRIARALGCEVEDLLERPMG